MVRALILLAFALTAFGSLNARAHEQAIGFTEILLKQSVEGDCAPTVCRIEVAHRLSIHDAESTLMNVLGARADLVGDPEAQQKLSVYVSQMFELTDASSGDAIDLTLLGGEVERGYFWVYQEAETPDAIRDYLIRHAVLMDAIPNQSNRVNIKLHDEIKTLVFNGSPGPKRVAFD